MADTKAPEATPDIPAAERSLWSRTWFVLSLALVLGLVVAAVWIVVDDPDPVRPSGPHPTVTGAVPGTEDACGPDGGSQTPPAATPDNDWYLLGSMAAPRNRAVGPADSASGVPVCFSPDPLGALFAAATYVAAGTDPELRRPLLEVSTAESEGRYAALRELDASSTSAVTPGVQIAGFDFLSYLPGRSAIIDLALSSRGALVHVPIKLIWAGRDWLVELPVTGRPVDQQQRLDNLAGYIAWQGA